MEKNLKIFCAYILPFNFSIKYMKKINFFFRYKLLFINPSDMTYTIHMHSNRI